MHMRLLSAVTRLGRMNGPCVGVLLADFLLHPLPDQLLLLLVIQFTRQGYFHFAVCGAIRPFMLIRCLPEL